MQFPDLAAVSADPDLVRCAQQLEAVLGGREWLRRSDISPRLFKWMLGRIFMVEVLKASSDYRFRLFGSKMVQVYGEDLTGRKLSEVRSASFEEALRADFDLVVATRTPHFQRGTLLWPDREFVGVERLLTPLSDADGEVSAILGAVAYHANLQLIQLPKPSAAQYRKV